MTRRLQTPHSVLSSSSSSLDSLELSHAKSTSLKYEPSSEPLHISKKYLFLNCYPVQGARTRRVVGQRDGRKPRVEDAHGESVSSTQTSVFNSRLACPTHAHVFIEHARCGGRSQEECARDPLTGCGVEREREKEG